MPGSAKPATPTTSFTRTVIARLPSAITADSPPFVPTGASFDSITGSPRDRLVRTTRPSSAFVSVNAPVGTLPDGQLTMWIWFGPSGSPRFRSVVATATDVTELVDVCISQWEANTTAARPAIIATTSIMTARLFFMAMLLDES